MWKLSRLNHTMVKQYNKNIAKVAILFYLFILTMQYNNGTAWTSSNGKKKEIYSHQNYTNKFSPIRRGRFKKKIPSTTTERGIFWTMQYSSMNIGGKKKEI